MIFHYLKILSSYLFKNNEKILTTKRKKMHKFNLYSGKIQIDHKINWFRISISSLE